MTAMRKDISIDIQSDVTSQNLAFCYSLGSSPEQCSPYNFRKEAREQKTHFPLISPCHRLGFSYLIITTPDFGCIGVASRSLGLSEVLCADTGICERVLPLEAKSLLDFPFVFHNRQCYRGTRDTLLKLYSGSQSAQGLLAPSTLHQDIE
jgi:hypothetical protein